MNLQVFSQCSHAKTDLCVLFQGAALLGGVNALHTAFPYDPEKEYIVQGRWGV